MPANEVKWNEAVLAPIELSPEEQEAVRRRMKAVDDLLKTDKRARYKIELFFGKARSLHSPTPGILSLWESGSKLHGGGDAKIFVCPGKLLGRSDCQAVIPEAANVSSTHFCPSCRVTWTGSQVIGEHIANLPMKKWANVLFHYFQRLDFNADIYLKFSTDDIRTTAFLEQEKNRGGELYNKTRSRRGKLMYPLSHIIKDTSAGADLLGRFVAFLMA